MAGWKPRAVRKVLYKPSPFRKDSEDFAIIISLRDSAENGKPTLPDSRQGGRKLRSLGASPGKYGMLRASFVGTYEKLTSPKEDCLVCMSLNWTGLRLPGRMMTVWWRKVGYEWEEQETRKEVKEQKHFNISPSPGAPGFQGLLRSRVIGDKLTPGGLLLPQGWVGDPGGRQ